MPQVNFEKSKLRSAIYRSQWLNFIGKDSALPGILSTRTFSNELAATLEGKAKSIKKNKNLVSKMSAPCVYQTVRFDGKLRFLEFPHPLPYSQLGEVIVENWEELRKLCQTPESTLAPSFSTRSDRVIAYSYNRNTTEKGGFGEDLWLSALDEGLAGRPQGNGRASFRDPKLLKLDIANFFPSVYTHAIDWAIEGGRVKKMKGRIGADVDAAFQGSRTARTDGIAIGPVTSNIAAEIILNELDRELIKLKERGSIDFRRFVDDIHILMPGATDEREIIKVVSRKLQKVSLSLNFGKQKTHSVYDELGNDIAAKVDEFLSSRKTLSSPVRVKNLVADLHAFALEQNDLSVLRFSWPIVISQLRSDAMDGALVQFVFESIHLMAYHPELAPRVVKLLEEDHRLKRRVSAHRPTVEFLLRTLSDALYSSSVEFGTWLFYLCEVCDIDYSGEIAGIVLLESGDSSYPVCVASVSIETDFSDAIGKMSDDDKLRMREVFSPLIGLSIMRRCEQLLYSSDMTETCVVAPNFIMDFLVSIYTGDPLNMDERVDDWSAEWPIRYQLFREERISLDDLQSAEEACFPEMMQHQFTLI